MKKLQILTIAMLLSTGFIVQTSDDSDSNQLSARQLRKLQNEQANQDQSPRNLPPMPMRPENGVMRPAVMPGNGPIQPERPEPRPFGRPQESATQNEKNSRPNRDAIAEQAATAIGSDLSYASIASYADQLSPAIASLSTSSTPDELQAVREMVRNIGFSLRSLNQNSGPDLQENKPAQTKNGNSRRRGQQKPSNSDVVVQMRNSSESEEN